MGKSSDFYFLSRQYIRTNKQQANCGSVNVEKSIANDFAKACMENGILEKS